jgi:hypothetical protein
MEAKMSERFDTLDPVHMTGDIGMQVLDLDGDPNLVLPVNRDWKIRVDWKLQGTDQNGNQTVGSLGGDWKIRAYAESVGPGDEKKIADVTVPLNSQPPTSPRNYATLLNIPANTLEPGPYKIVVLVNYSNLGMPKRMAAFAEGPVVEIYEFA